MSNFTASFNILVSASQEWQQSDIIVIIIIIIIIEKLLITGIQLITSEWVV